MPASSFGLETLHAACRVAAAGGFVALAVPRGVTSAVIGAAGVYTITLPAANAIDITDAITMVNTSIIDSSGTSLQTTDLSVGVLTFTASVGAALSALFCFAMWRTATGPG